MTDDAPEDRRLLGTLRSVDGEGVIRVEDRFHCGIDDVWAALTDPGRLARWLGRLDGDLRPGGEFRAFFYASGWEGSGRVEACERPHRLLVLTQDDDDPAEGAIEVTLTAYRDDTVISWEERGRPLNYLAAYGAGIQIHVEDLADHLAGRERRDSKARFDQLFPAYQALGPARE